MAVSEILALLELRGRDLRQADVDEIEIMVALLPEAESEAVGGVWEIVAQIIGDPEYTGDAKMPDLVE